MKKIDSKVWKGLIALVAIVLLAVALINSLKGSQTLNEYAAAHPDEQVKVEISPIAETKAEDVAADNEASSEIDSEVSTEAISSTDSDASSEDVIADDGSDNVNGLSFDDEYEGSADRTIYQEGFYYEPIPQVVREKMTGLSYPEDIDETKVCFDDLRYVRLKYVDFNGESADGEMVCNKAIAQDVVEIFYELYEADYRIESIRLIDDFGADDTASMAANNTSCFCYRVVDNSTSLSNHAYGRAIDLNPFYNPYIVFKAEGDYISPPGSEIYADRTQNFAYKIDENDLACILFKQHGFRWGGDWNSCKDYQHFDKKK